MHKTYRFGDQPSQAYPFSKPVSLRLFVLAAFIFVFLLCSSSARAVQNETNTNSILGDVNRDGILSFVDISPLITLLTTGVYQFEADVDGDGVVNFLDIAPFIALFSTSSSEDPTNSKPNIVIIIVDDLGLGDLDDEHMPFTSGLFKSRGTSMNLYSHQNCTPSRAALLTGMNPMRFNQHNVFGPPVNEGVPASIPLLPEFLQGAGYKTTLIGKWHLGMGDDQVPTLRGFDSFVGFRGGHIRSYGSLPGGLPYPDGTLGHDHHTRHDLAENGTSFYTSQYSTHLFRDESVEFIESTESDEDPFFAYLSFNAPHAPYHAPRASFDAVKLEHGVTAADEEYLFSFAEDVVGLPIGTTAPEAVQDKLNKAIYYAMVKDLDATVEQIWSALVDSGKADNTMFLFTSDNGGRVGFTDNGGFRGGKGTPYEGGHYVANGIIAPWIEADQEITADIWMADLTPTILKLAGIDYDELDMDGATAIDAMTTNAEVVRKDGLVSFPCHIDKRYRPSLNIIKATGTIHGSNMKYIRFYDFELDGTTIISTVESLYDLSVDPLETRSVHRIRDYAEIIVTMRAEYDFWIGNERMSEIKAINLPNQWAGFVFPDEWGDY